MIETFLAQTKKKWEEFTREILLETDKFWSDFTEDLTKRKIGLERDILRLSEEEKSRSEAVDKLTKEQQKLEDDLKNKRDNFDGYKIRQQELINKVLEIEEREKKISEKESKVNIKEKELNKKEEDLKIEVAFVAEREKNVSRIRDSVYNK